MDKSDSVDEDLQWAFFELHFTAPRLRHYLTECGGNKERAVQLSIRASEPHPIVPLSPTVRAEEHQRWCGSAPLVLPVTDYAVTRAARSLML